MVLPTRGKVRSGGGVLVSTREYRVGGDKREEVVVSDRRQKHCATHHSTRGMTRLGVAWRGVARHVAAIRESGRC